MDRERKHDFRIGIDLGGTKTEIVVLRGNPANHPRNNTVLRKRTPTNRECEYKHIVYQTASLIANAVTALPANSSVFIGVGMPGGVERVSGLIKNSNTICLNGRPFRENLMAASGHKIIFSNDANCFALAEAVWGAGKNHDLVFGAIMGTGIGGGIVCHQRIHEGSQGIAGEWGHLCLIPDGRHCYCGHRGCVETYLSGPALSADLSAANTDCLLSDLNRLLCADSIDSNPSLKTILYRYLDWFGLALANVINILDPDIIVLGGGLSNMEFIYDLGPQFVSRHIFNTEAFTPIIKNQLGDDAGVFGAAILDCKANASSA